MLKQLRDRYATISHQMKSLASANETFNDSQRSEWNSLEQHLSDVEAQIRWAEKSEANVGPDPLVQEQRDRSQFDQGRKAFDLGNDDPNRPLTEYERTAAFNAWALGIHAKDEVGIRAAKRLGIDLRNNQLDWSLDRGVTNDGMPLKAPKSLADVRENSRIRREVRQAEVDRYRDNPERRAQSVGTTTEGGFTVPDEMMAALEESLLAWGGMRQVASIITTATGADMPVPMVNDTSQKGAILAENTAASDQDLVFAQKVFKAYKYSSKVVKCSVELMQDSSINLPQFLGSALGTRIGRITNDHFTTGDGSSKPGGILTRAGNSSITSASGTSLVFGEPLALLHSVDPAYRTGASFMAHDSTVLKLRSMVDGQSRPVWEPALQLGQPGTLYGYPVVTNQSMPEFALSAKALIFGQLSKYVIRDVQGITILRLDERYAEAHQVAFLGFARHDGDLLDAGTDPVKYLTMKSS